MKRIEARPMRPIYSDDAGNPSLCAALALAVAIVIVLAAVLYRLA